MGARPAGLLRRRECREAVSSARHVDKSAPKAPPLPSRDEQVACLANTQEFDVLVVGGGGATGAGAALDAQMRGLSGHD